MLASFAVAVIAVFLWFKATGSRKRAAAMAILAFFYLLFIGLYYAADFLTGAGIDESILFHLTVGMQGAGYGAFRDFGIFGLLYLFAITALSYGIYKISQSHSGAYYGRLRAGAGAIALLLAFAINPATQDLKRLYRVSQPVEATASGMASWPDGYIDPGDIRLGRAPKNIVYLYLESLERTYMDERAFPGLLPELQELEKQALSFTDIRQVFNTGWTIAGMTASQCGMPLIIPSRGSSMSGIDRFLPGANCLGDVLAGNGYRLNYMGGADLDFGGKGQFYTTHGFDRVEGFGALESLLEDPSYISPWGLHDDTMLNAAKRRYDDLSATDQPFGLFLLTLDTHHPNGYISRACEGLEYGDGGNRILNAVRCADLLAADFIKYVMASEGFEDTLLVVSSDHLAMPNTAWNQLEKAERRNLFMVFGSDQPAGTNPVSGSMLDVAPTLLSLLGSDSQAYGFGRNLLGEGPTLAGGDAPVDAILRQGRRYLSLLWSIPQLDDGIQVDLAARQLELGQRRLRFPALFTLDNDLGVREIRFDVNRDQPLEAAISSFPFDQRFLWIDQCAKTGNLDRSVKSAADGYCIVYGATGAENLGFAALAEGMEIDLPYLRYNFDRMTFRPEIAASRLGFFDLARRYELGDAVRYQPRKELDGHFALRSAGLNAGPSSVINLELEQAVPLLRGLSIIGLNAGLSPVQMGHIDTCAYDGAIQDEMELGEGGFQAVIERYSDSFGAFAIVADDSAQCATPYDLAPLFSGTGLVRWNEIGFRQPYIGLIAGNGDISEYLGDTETAILVEAVDFIRPTAPVEQRLVTELPRVAHGGGGYDGAVYSNSIEALNQNRDDYELFEIDLSWTTDNELVCIHDWENSLQRVFGIETQDALTLAAFQDLVRTRSPIEKCTLETLADWMRANETKRIIPDIKGRNLQAWEKIAAEYPDLRERFVPQVYQPQNYNKLRDLGFENVVWALYGFGGSDEDVLRWLTYMDLYGVAMPIERAGRALANRARMQTGVLSWVHTINTRNQLDEMRALGVFEIFTEWMPAAAVP